MSLGLQVWSSSQSPHSIMQGTAMVLGLPQSRCTARCRRMGGAFGGKTTRSVVPAAAVAVAANKLKRQVCHLSVAPSVVPDAAAPAHRHRSSAGHRSSALT